tara:strand:- start:828 stop:1004 length:177 start_codon:yes stop_codon:yes gene_type:complete
VKKKYKLVYLEGGEEVTLVSTDSDALMIVLNEKVSSHVGRYRNSVAFELVSYGELDEE